MASTWSALKVELQGTGDNSGTWGALTNVNLGDDILGEAITGSTTVAFLSAADFTLTLTDSTTSQPARNLRLNITESGAGIGYVGNLILGSGCQIEKFYLIRNTTTGAKTIKNTSGTGVAVAAGKATLVYNDGTNVVDVLNSFSSAILGAENAGSIIPFYFANQAAFPSASTYHGAIAHSHADGAMYFAHSGVWVRMLNDGGPLGTPSGGTLTNVSGLPIDAGTTGTLPINRGGTGTTSTTFANLTTNVTGTLPVTNGGTGIATTTAYSVVFAGTTATGAFQAAAGPGTATHVLTSNGTGALPTFQAPAGAGNLTGAVTSVGLTTSLGSFTSANLLAALTDETGTGSAVFATSPTLVTPLLGTPTSGVLSACTVDGTDAVGFRNIPLNSQSAAYTLVLADSGKTILHPASDANARTFTIPANSSVAYPVGTAVTFINMTSQVVTIAITTDTMYLSDAGTTGSRSLAQYGSATAIKITSTNWLISGSGLT